MPTHDRSDSPCPIVVAALSLLASALLLAGCSSDEQRWQEAQDADTIEAYESYIRRHADGQYAEDASARLDYLRETAIFRAIAADDLEAVKHELDMGFGIDDVEVAGMAPLHVAGERCRMEIAKFLVDAGADVNTTGKARATPLHWAAGAGCLDIVNFLLSEGADPLAEVPHSLSGYVVKGGGAEFFGGNDYSTKGTPLHWAAAGGHERVVERLLEVSDIDALNSSAESPLFLAAAAADVETAKLLLDAGAKVEIDESARFGPSPKSAGQAIHYAASVEVAKLLQEHGARLDTVATHRGMPLHVAAYRGHDELVDYFLSEGLDPDIAGPWDVDGWPHDLPPSWLAAFGGHMETLKTLERHGANLEFDAGSRVGGTLLHAAALSGDTDTLRYLLDKGLEIDARGSTPSGQPLMPAMGNMTPLAVASRYGRLEAVELLVDSGADINAQVYEAGWSMIDMPLVTQQTDVAKFLLERAIDIPFSASEIESRNTSDEIKAMLRKHLTTQD